MKGKELHKCNGHSFKNIAGVYEYASKNNFEVVYREKFGYKDTNVYLYDLISK